MPQTVAPLRCVAMDVKWLPGWGEDVRIKSVNIVDEASNLHEFDLVLNLIHIIALCVVLLHPGLSTLRIGNQ